MAIILNGTNQYIELPQTVLAGATTFTIEIEAQTTCYITQPNNYQWPTFVGREIGGTYQNDFGLCVNDGYLCFWSEPKTGGSNSTRNTTTMAYIADGAYHKMAVVAADGAIDLYCDGVNVAHTDNVNPCITDSYTILMGYNSDNSSWLPFVLQEARFWNVARNASDLFSAIDGSETELKAWLRCKATDVDISAQTLKDYSSYNQNVKIYNYTPYIIVTANFDTCRIKQNDSYAGFRYENVGYREKTYLGGHTIENATGEKTKTGVAFWQPSKNDSNPFPSVQLPSLSELWVKFDIYRNGTAWRLYLNSDNGGGHLGFYDDGTLHCVVSNSRVANAPTSTNGLHTILFHAISDATAGTVEYWYDGEKITSYVGKVNNGLPFDKICFQADNANALFSNIIISETQIGFDEDAAAESIWIQPTISSNGTWDESDLAVKSSSGTTNPYRGFNDECNDYADYFDTGSYLDICLKDTIKVDHLNLYCQNNYLPASGLLFYSDDGENYTECGSWTDELGTSTVATVSCTNSAKHKYWRLQITARPTKRPGNKGAFGNINFFAQGTVSFIVTASFDTCRKVTNIVTPSVDTCRKTGNIITANVDTLRRLGTTVTVTANFDTCRKLGITQTAKFDTCRRLGVTAIANFDTCRKLAQTVTAKFDTLRKLTQTVTVNFDTCRKVNNLVTAKFDTRRLIPHTVSYKPDEMQPPETKTPYNRLVSAQISIREQTVCDDITLDIANCDLVPYDPLKGSLLDYDFSDYIVRSTSHQEAVMTINSMIDWKKYIAVALRYPYFNGDGDVEEAVEDDTPQLRAWRNSSSIIGGKQAYSYTKKPTTTAQYHLNYIADCLGVDRFFLFDDFVPSNGYGNETITYLSLISNFFSWSKEVPWRQINVFIRDNVLYAIQRGKEPNTVILDNIRHSRPQIQREVMAISKSRWLALGAHIVKDYYIWTEWDDTDDEGRLTAFSVGNGSIKVTYGDGGYIRSLSALNLQGSHDVEYDYKNITPLHKQIYEKHTIKDSDGNTETSELYSTPLGNGQSISTYLDEDGKIASSIVSSNRNPSGRIVAHGGIGGERTFKYHYILEDSFGNSLDIDLDSEQDTSIFPVYDVSNVEYNPPQEYGYTHTGVTIKAPDTDPLQNLLWDEIKAYNNKTQEVVSLDILCPVKNGVPDYGHIIDFRDKLILNGHEYYLMSNTAKISPRELRQSITMVRWY